MTYVRERRQPASKTAVRLRAVRNREVVNATAGLERFGNAYGWFRAAYAYAGRRTYRSVAVKEAALTRREQIMREAARVTAEAAAGIGAALPMTPKENARTAGFRSAFAAAVTAADQMTEAHRWILSSSRQLDRWQNRLAFRGRAAGADGAVRQRARSMNAAGDYLAARAEEMDDDSYGE